jgi:hypothetical protein
MSKWIHCDACDATTEQTVDGKPMSFGWYEIRSYHLCSPSCLVVYGQREYEVDVERMARRMLEDKQESV